jgi:hypothetical protein
MRQIVDAGRLPAAGALGKWKLEESGRVTSQFVPAYRSREAKPDVMDKMGLELEEKAIEAIEAIGLKSEFKRIHANRGAAVSNGNRGRAFLPGGNGRKIRCGPD